jgi:hypothetical protein
LISSFDAQRAVACLRIDYGALYGLVGIHLEFRKADRLVVSVTLFRRSVAVEIDRDWVSLVRSSGRPRSGAAVSFRLQFFETQIPAAEG